jgi:hypothetical protein
MSETKELLEKIAALRQRLGAEPPLPVPRAADAPQVRIDPPHDVGESVRRGAWHSRLIDRSLRPHDPAVQAPPMLPARLTASGARLLKKGRDLLQALRAMADEPVLQADPHGPLAEAHAAAAGMIDTILRSVQAFPPSPSEQLRLCEGLDAVLESVEERVAVLTAGLGLRRREAERIDYLAEILRRLAAGEPVAPPPLQALAETLVQEARAGLPLRFLAVAPRDPARFAAAHGLTVAQVFARLLLDEPDGPGSLLLAVMAALVHDVGMARVPAEVLGKPGPLDDAERRVVEMHAAAGGPMVAPLWPGGGWPIEAVTDHHERPDGTGYPSGHKEIEVAAPVRLLAVCDVYAALCSPRPHRPALDSRTALTETLLLAERDALDRQQAEQLLRLSFYPPGSAVELSDGAAALVLAAQSGPRGLANPARPVVLLLTDAPGQAPAVPRVVDLVQENDRSVVRALSPAERRRLLDRRYPALA